MSLACEIKTAARKRQADVVLKLHLSRGSGFGEGSIEAAQAVLELAQRMRLPYGRHGAWSKHLQLLRLVCTIVDSWEAANTYHGQDPAIEALRKRAHELLNSGDPSIRKQK